MGDCRRREIPPEVPEPLNKETNGTVRKRCSRFYETRRLFDRVFRGFQKSSLTWSCGLVLYSADSEMSP